LKPKDNWTPKNLDQNVESAVFAVFAKLEGICKQTMTLAY
jgi:hypothetical protein